jgi:hypothetical protein
LDNTASTGQLVVGTHDRNKKAGIPATTGIPASTTADYTGNFGLAQKAGRDRSFPCNVAISPDLVRQRVGRLRDRFM